jgi:DNA primase
MSRHKLEYRDFVDAIDLDVFEEAIGFEPLEHRNGEDIGYCPDFWGLHKHGDTTGKFAINREKRVYHCFVCSGGTLLSLAMEHNQMDEETATEWLYQFAHGDTRTDTEFVDDFMKLLDDYAEKKGDRMPYFNEHVLKQFDAAYHALDLDGEPISWYEERGISEEIQQAYRLCYGANHKKVAPIRGGEKIAEDYFGPCIAFPHFWEGRLVGWQHRWLNHGKDTPKWLPKYTNTSDFPKKQTLYNYDRAIKHPASRVVVVESCPTAGFLESMKIPAVGAFGSGITEGQLRLLRRFTEGVIFAPDNDKPGVKFANIGRAYLERYIDVTVLKPVELGEGADLGDYMKTDDPVGNLYDHLETAVEDDVFGIF